MSEEERNRRINYRQKRKKRITAVSILLIIAIAFTIISASLALFLNRTYYVDYAEKSSIKYGVHLKDNNHYDEDYLGEDSAYIASLINILEANFKYQIVMDFDEDASFDYTWRVDSVVEIKDKVSGKVIYQPTDPVAAEKSATATGKNVDIEETVFVDYPKYNDIADNFFKTYKLENASANLLVQLHVNVTATSEELDNEKLNKSYVSSISIPLTQKTVDVKVTSNVPQTEQAALSYTTESTASIFKKAAIISLCISLLILIILLAYAYLSRNVDITYEIKVKRLVSAYKSFIQKLMNEFDASGYQVLILSTFNEMLAIRDTIQSPILMHENEDKTCTKFFIPTNTNLVYLFEIKVDDYDKIYAGGAPNNEPPAPTEPDDFDADAKKAEDPIVENFTVEEAPVEQPVVTEETPTEDPIVEDTTAEQAPVEQPVVTEEAPTEEPIVEDTAAEQAPVEQPVVTEEAPETEREPEIDQTILDHIIELDGDENDEDSAIAYVDDFGNIVKITCSRSFTANLIQSNPQVKYYYDEIKSRILSYNGAKARTSWRCESFNKGRIQLFKLKIRGKTICLYCALDPNDYDKAKYFHEVTTAKKFALVPMMVRIKSDRGLKRALGLVDDVMARFSIKENKNAEKKAFSEDFPYDTTKNLVERKLIKLLLPDAVAQEPKPHHHEHTMTLKVEHDNVVDELIIFDSKEVNTEDINEIIEAPTPVLEEIDFDESTDEVEGFVETEDHPGVDVIGVVWPERPKRNKIYRYDPDGESVEVGDIVIVPTRDVSRNKEVIRKAAVAHANHKIDPDTLTVPVKKIIGVIRTKKSEDKK